MAFDGKVWWKGTLQAVPRTIPKDPKDPYNLWIVRSQTGDIFSTDCVRHADLISLMVAEVGQDVFTDLVKKGLSEVQEQSEQQGFKVEKPQELMFPDGTPALASRLKKIESIRVLQDVRNKVPNSDLESAVNKGLATTFTTKFTEKWQVRLDKTFFCEIFEKELLRFSKLTRHQHEKLGDVENLLNGGPVHLSAPAGSGKTFIAVQCAYKKIKQSSEGVLSFVAPSIDLGLYFFQWLAQRFGEHMSVHDLLSRVVLMQAPYESFMTLHDEDGRLITKPSEGEPQFLLTIVDEAHDVFQSIDYDRFFHKVKAEQRLLLSSKSQASGTDVVFAGAKEVKLTEIVRTTKRIVAGSAAFQGREGEKEGVTSICPAGPPLKSFLFDSGARVDFEKYGQKTITALWDLIGTYAGLSFHQRLAMLVPNDTFLTGFKEQIRRLLAQFPGRNFKLTSFRDSLAILANQETKQTAEALIIDTVANAKGLEKLIIICIGLDEKLGDQKTNCETRALIYQALTRAQLQVVVVNQLLPGGWFEFLGKVKFKEDIFDESSAMKETTTQAASQSISQTVPSVESRAAASDRHPPSPGRIASSATQRDSHVPPVREPEPPIVSTDQGIDQLKEQDSCHMCLFVMCFSRLTDVPLLWGTGLLRVGHR